jgi:hypothetical protein
MYFFVMMTKRTYLKKMPIPLLFNGNRGKTEVSANFDAIAYSFELQK